MHYTITRAYVVVGGSLRRRDVGNSYHKLSGKQRSERQQTRSHRLLPVDTRDIKLFVYKLP